MIDYDIVALARGQKVLFYRQFGSYQGEWLILARDNENYYVYKDCFGSCSGCDAIQAEFYFDTDDLLYDSPKIQGFIKDYPPQVIIPHLTAWKFATKGEFGQLLPANIRDTYSDISWEEVEKQCSLLVKSIEGGISALELLQLDNQEARREAVERYGAERFVLESSSIQIHQDGENVLYCISQNGKEDFIFLYLKDVSTNRRYILRVPPSTKTVKDGVSWTFNIKPSEYNPISQT